MIRSRLRPRWLYKEFSLLRGWPSASAGSVRRRDQGRFFRRRRDKPWVNRTRAFTILHRETPVQQHSVTSAIAQKIIRSIRSSFSLPTAPSILVTGLGDSPSRQAPPGCRKGPIYLSGRRSEDSRRPPRPGKETGIRVSAMVLWSHRFTLSPSISAEPGRRGSGHNESLYRGSAARIRRVRGPSS